MIWFLGSVAYLLLHGVIYFAMLRASATFTSERGVFLYHAVSGVLFSVAALAALVWPQASGITPALAVGTIMLHGMYSLSFLELWSLTEGGYSLQILRAIGSSEALGQTLGLAELEQIGRGKQQSRTGSLEAFGWVTRSEQTIRLTPRGRVVANVLHGLYSLVSTEQGQ